MILSCNHISKSFGTDQIINDCSFHLEEREKAAIIGINGAGKSTLLKIIVGELPADSGNVTVSKGKTLGYLSQHQNLSTDKTIYDELLSVKQDLIDMENTIRSLEIQMKDVTGDELDNNCCAMAAQFANEMSLTTCFHSIQDLIMNLR